MRFINGDEVMPIVASAEKELTEKDTAFVMNDFLCLYEDDAQNYARIRRTLVEVFTKLRSDDMRGMNAIEKIDDDIFRKHTDLAYRLVESNDYPAFTNLYELIQIYQ